jgi:hypothetical protein
LPDISSGGRVTVTVITCIPSLQFKRSHCTSGTAAGAAPFQPFVYRPVGCRRACVDGVLQSAQPAPASSRGATPPKPGSGCQSLPGDVPVLS